jgi:plasmid stability protein
MKSRLRIQAARHGRSMEDEARDILRSALNREPTQWRDFLRPFALASSPSAAWNWKSHRANLCAGR